ncbi:MAG: hypothetical protein OXR66_02355 [Candidatus Woesearchaeota archaeon]|nr:hypothetical protein [Candidatus Woesearchaeota archaeon]
MFGGKTLVIVLAALLALAPAYADLPLSSPTVTFGTPSTTSATVGDIVTVPAELSLSMYDTIHVSFVVVNIQGVDCIFLPDGGTSLIGNTLCLGLSVAHNGTINLSSEYLSGSDNPQLTFTTTWNTNVYTPGSFPFNLTVIFMRSLGECVECGQQFALVYEGTPLENASTETLVTIDLQAGTINPQISGGGGSGPPQGRCSSGYTLVAGFCVAESILPQPPTPPTEETSDESEDVASSDGTVPDVEPPTVLSEEEITNLLTGQVTGDGGTGGGMLGLGALLLLLLALLGFYFLRR